MELDDLDGHPLPVSARIVARARDYRVIALPSAVTKPPTFIQTAVILSEDKQADPTVLGILFALHYAAPLIRAGIVGIAKVNGRIRVWCSEPETFEYTRVPLIEACRAAYWPHSRIDTDPLVLVKMLPDGTVDRDNLGPDGALLRVVPERYKLGLVRAS